MTGRRRTIDQLQRTHQHVVVILAARNDCTVHTGKKNEREREREREREKVKPQLRQDIGKDIHPGLVDDVMFIDVRIDKS
jgi:hypothetical protein